jgi:hypothetical protein
VRKPTAIQSGIWHKKKEENPKRYAADLLLFDPQTVNAAKNARGPPAGGSASSPGAGVRRS